MSRCPPLPHGPKDRAETAWILENLTQSQDNFLSVPWAGQVVILLGSYFSHLQLRSAVEVSLFKTVSFGYQVYKVNCPAPLLIMKMLNIFSCA